MANESKFKHPTSAWGMVLECAVELHMIALGSSDCDGEEVASRLTETLSNWKPSTPRTTVFDGTVYSLCRQALDEYKSFMERMGFKSSVTGK